MPLFSQAALQPFAAATSFPLHSSQDSSSIQHEVMPSRPFSVVGPVARTSASRMAPLNYGSFRGRCSAMCASRPHGHYPVPIDVNDRAPPSRCVPTQPSSPSLMPTLTRARSILAPKQTRCAGALVLYQIESCASHDAHLQLHAQHAAHVAGRIR